MIWKRSIVDGDVVGRWSNLGRQGVDIGDKKQNAKKVEWKQC